MVASPGFISDPRVALTARQYLTTQRVGYGNAKRASRCGKFDALDHTPSS
jgi:hypothetical protein